MRSIKFETLALGLFLTIYSVYTAHALSYPNSDYDENVQWANVPPDIKETIVSKGQGGHIETVTKEVKGNGTYYYAEVETPDGRKILLRVAERGELLESKYKNGSEDEEASAAPTPTR